MKNNGICYTLTELDKKNINELDCLATVIQNQVEFVLKKQNELKNVFIKKTEVSFECEADARIKVYLNIFVRFTSWKIGDTQVSVRNRINLDDSNFIDEVAEDLVSLILSEVEDKEEEV